ncbi:MULTISPECIES: TetR/AcrR family transcriptional regulator [Methanobrevibacter]|jgi:AcrR family transcriptional regulator|uniref:TetR/AcrR family transcriptional regulator n=1 Tax=Methanobrevibacter TaxID=2172 RepID=UPI0003815100|nr:TetR/AcrR family transcriptional regulator [Methanobrevibacter smithii]
MEIELDKTEQKIVDATIFLLDKEGMNGTTTKKIAKKAEVSEVTVFRKFKSKDNLLKIAKIYYSDYFLEKISDIFTNYEDTDLESLLKNTWWKLVNFLDNNLDIIKIALDELMSSPEEEKMFSKFSDEVLKNLTNIFQEQIDKGKIRKINPSAAALTVFSVIVEGIIFWKFESKVSNDDINKYLDDFLDIFINGITN